MLGGPNRLVSHFDLEISQQIEIRKILLSWSPATESNRRPSPYHACRFRLLPSDSVRLPQVGGIAVSGCVVLRPALPGAVVTWFVTGSGPQAPMPIEATGRSAPRSRSPADPRPRSHLPIPADCPSAIRPPQQRALRLRPIIPLLGQVRLPTARVQM